MTWIRSDICIVHMVRTNSYHMILSDFEWNIIFSMRIINMKSNFLLRRSIPISDLHINSISSCAIFNSPSTIFLYNTILINSGSISSISNLNIESSCIMSYFNRNITPCLKWSINRNSSS